MPAAPSACTTKLTPLPLVNVVYLHTGHQTTFCVTEVPTVQFALPAISLPFVLSG
jgi:hypothetical protein